MINSKRYDKKMAKLNERIENAGNSFVGKIPIIYESIIEIKIRRLEEKRANFREKVSAMVESDKKRLDDLGLCVTVEGKIIEKNVQKLCDLESVEANETSLNNFRKLGLVVPRFDYKEKTTICRITPLGQKFVNDEEIRAYHETLNFGTPSTEGTTKTTQPKGKTDKAEERTAKLEMGKTN